VFEPGGFEPFTAFDHQAVVAGYPAPIRALSLHSVPDAPQHRWDVRLVGARDLLVGVMDITARRYQSLFSAIEKRRILMLMKIRRRLFPSEIIIRRDESIQLMKT